MRKAGKTPDADAFQPPSAEIRKLGKIAGNYAMKGWYMMAPGQPKMDIAADEVIAPIFGGSILEIVVEGKPTEAMGGFAYRAWSAIAWDADDECYRQIFVNNMGEDRPDRRLVDRRRPTRVHARNVAKRTTGTRTNPECSATRTARSSRHRPTECRATAPPVQSFSGEYTVK